MSDSITILTCQSKGAMATKTFSKKDDGTIEKQSYGASMFFEHEQKKVSSLKEAAGVFTELANKSLCFVIRGEPMHGIGHTVRRKMHGEGAAFEAKARQWVMLDMDKIDCPSHLNPVDSPDEAAQWVKESLPEPFKNSTCWYKFSSSQSVMNNNTISVHFLFWCNRPIDEQEWKQFFRLNKCAVDSALFSPVQIHYTANPIFENMADPLNKRSGFLEGETEIVIMPTISRPDNKPNNVINVTAPNVDTKSAEQALELLQKHYPKEGGRERFCATVAAVLFRGGWPVEEIAEFILSLANGANDEECMKRQDNVFRICERIDCGQYVMGIPTLKDEFCVDDLDEILSLLGVGKPDVAAAIETLTNATPSKELENVLKMLLPFSTAERELYIDDIKLKTNVGKTTLNKIFNELKKAAKNSTSNDSALVLMETMLHEHYYDGEYLLRTVSGDYWGYNGKCWEVIPNDLLKQKLLLLAPSIAEDKERISSMVNAALSLLEGRVFKEGDPLYFKNEPPAVINCSNGEVWFDAMGEITFKPHNYKSYLRHCVDVEYAPAATCPKFDRAVLEIFSKSTAPNEMHRHFMEVMGYIIQPWRKIPTIMLLYGGGNNGKTSLMETITRFLSNGSVMSARINDIEKSPFKIGALSNKLLLLDDDVEAGTVLPDGFLKKISEEKMMTGEHKHRDSFEFQCRAVPVLLANQYPSSKDLTYGLQRRLMAIPFERRFKQDEVQIGLFDKIWEAEKSGILNQAIEGFGRLKKRGNFDEPKDCRLCKKEWIARSNLLASFIEDECDKGDKEKQRFTEFYQRFNEHARESGHSNIPTKQGVKARLEGLGYDFSLLDGYSTVRGVHAPDPFRMRDEAK